MSNPDRHETISELNIIFLIHFVSGRLYNSALKNDKRAIGEKIAAVNIVAQAGKLVPDANSSRRNPSLSHAKD